MLLDLVQHVDDEQGGEDRLFARRIVAEQRDPDASPMTASTGSAFCQLAAMNVGMRAPVGGNVGNSRSNSAA